MKHNLKKPIRILSWTCIAMLAVLLVFQFIPFWEVDGQSLSIASYIWFPVDHEDLTMQLKATIGQNYNILSIVASHATILLLGIAGVIMGIWKTDGVGAPLCALLSGIMGTCGYYGRVAYQLGSNWRLHGVVSIVLLIVAVVTVGLKLMEYLQHRKH